MKNQRPVNLNLFTIRFPIPAIISILHRISGFVLFLLIPMMLWVLNQSLMSEEAFETIKYFFSGPLIKCVLWACLSAFIYHFIAGIRHLFMDIGIGEELKSSRLSAKLTLGISILLILLTGVWLW